MPKGLRAEIGALPFAVVSAILERRNNETGVAYISIHGLCLDTGLGEASVKAAIRIIKTCRIFEVESGGMFDGAKISNTYRLLPRGQWRLDLVGLAKRRGKPKATGAHNDPVGGTGAQNDPMENSTKNRGAQNEGGAECADTGAQNDPPTRMLNKKLASASDSLNQDQQQSFSLYLKAGIGERLAKEWASSRPLSHAVEVERDMRRRASGTIRNKDVIAGYILKDIDEGRRELPELPLTLDRFIHKWLSPLGYPDGERWQRDKCAERWAIIDKRSQEKVQSQAADVWQHIPTDPAKLYCLGKALREKEQNTPRPKALELNDD